MKKIYLMFLAAFAFLAASCQVEILESNDVPVNETMTITAGFGTETKTVLGDNGVSSLWHEDDKVSVFDTKVGDNNRCFSIVKEEGDEFPKATATFATAEEFTMPGDQTQDQALIVALYPYQETAYCDFFDPQDDVNKINEISVPVEQVSVAGGFDASATFALATGKFAERDNLLFQNLYSLLKVTVAEEGVKEIRVAFETEGFVAGDAQIVLNRELVDDLPVFKGGILTATGSKEVTLTPAGENATFDAGVAYGIAIAPITYTNIKVYLDGELAKDTTPAEAKTLEPNTYYNIKNLKKPVVKAERNLAFSQSTGSVTYSANGTFTLPDLTGEGDLEDVSYSIISGDAVRLNGNVATLVKGGDVTIKATVAEDETHLAGEASYTLTVNKAARQMSFSASTATMGDDSNFAEPVLTCNPAASVEYKSSDTSIATVDANGNVQRKSAGTVTITASVGETETYRAKSVSYTLTVQKILYLKPNTNWKDAGARFAACFMDANKGNHTWENLVADDTDGIYKVYVPTSADFKYVIFCRMNPSTATNGWDQKWDQTDDLTIPTNEKTYFVIMKGSWSNGNSNGDKWMSEHDAKAYVEPKDPEQTTRTIYLKPGVWTMSNAKFEAWTWGGTSADAWVKFTKLDNTYYSVEIPADRTYMKILRKDPNSASESWTSWNDSGDQQIPSDKNMFVVNDWDNYNWQTK